MGFPADDLVPDVLFCPEDYNIVGETRLTEVTWEEPVFRDPLGHDLEVNNNLAGGNTALLSWGRYPVVYTATNTDNGQKAVCQFDINVERKLKPDTFCKFPETVTSPDTNDSYSPVWPEFDGFRYC